MATRKGIESKLLIKCRKSQTTTELTTSNTTTSYKGLDLGTEADKEFGPNFKSFGYCPTLKGPCVPKIEGWIGLSDPSVTCNGNRLLNDKSQMYCSTGPALIDIVTDPPPPSVDQLNQIKALQNKMNGAIDKVNPVKKLSDQADKVVGKVKDGAGGVFSKMWGGFKKSTGAVMDAAGDVFDAAGDAVSEVVDDTKEAISDGVDFGR